MPPWPTDYEFAVLAHQAYNKEAWQRQKVYWNKDNLPSYDEWREKGWQLLKSSEGGEGQGAYHGYAWVNHQHKHLVIAHRGAAMSLGSLRANAEGVLFGELTSQQAAAAGFVASLLGASLPLPPQPAYQVEGLGFFSGDFTAYHLAFTGHGLGAWLAELCTATFHNLNAYAVTFDSPGAGPMLTQLAETNIAGHVKFRLAQLNVTTYLSAPNLINTCHPHVGQVRRVYLPDEQKKVAFLGWQKVEEKLAALKAWFTHTVTQHSMQGFLAVFDKHQGYPREQKTIEDWPCLEWAQLKKITGLSGLLPLPLETVFTLVKAFYFAGETLQEYRCFYQNTADRHNPQPETLELSDQYQLLYRGHYHALPTCQRLRVSHQHPTVKALLLLGGGLSTLPDTLKTLLQQGALHNLHLEDQRDCHWLLNDETDNRTFLIRLCTALKAHADVEVRLKEAVTLQAGQGARLLGLEYQFGALQTQVTQQGEQLSQHTQQLDDMGGRINAIEDATTLDPAHQAKRDEQLNTQLAGLQQALQGDHEKNALITLLFGGTWNLQDQGRYVNLAIIEEHLQKRKETQEKPSQADGESESSSRGQQASKPDPDDDEEGKASPVPTHLREQHLASFEDIYAIKKPVALDKLWETKEQVHGKAANDNAPPARFLMALGRAGVGKSTCCKYIALMHHTLWPGKFDFVFLVPWRALSTSLGFNAGMSLSEVLYEYWAKHHRVNKAQWETLYKKITAQPDKVLLLLDGYDELTPQQLGITTNLEQAPIVKALLEAPFYKVLTSRPYGVEKLRPGARLEITGFTDENIKTYVDYYFSHESTTASECFDFMHANPSIWGVAHIPVTLELLCGTWKENKSQLDDDFTLTRLYHSIFTSLLRRYLTKRKEEGDEALQKIDIQDLAIPRVWALSGQMLSFLSALAKQGLTEGNLIIGPHLIERCRQGKPDTILRDALLSGLLKGTESDKAVSQQSVYFIHLTFQEWLTAYALVETLRASEKADYKKAQRALKEIQYPPRYQVVVWFCAGLWDLPVGLSPWGAIQTPNRFWETLLAPPRDISLVYDASLLARCIEESAQARRSSTPLKHYCEATTLICRLLKGFANKVKALPKGLTRALTLCPHFMANHGVKVQIEAYEENNQARFSFFQEGKKIDIIYYLLHTWLTLGTGLRLSMDHLLPVFLQALKDNETHIRKAACQALTTLVPYLKEIQQNKVLAALLQALQDNEWDTHQAACQALIALAPHIKETQQGEALAALLQTLQDSDEDVRQAACQTLAVFTPYIHEIQQGEVVGSLLQTLQDSKGYVRQAASSALSALVPHIGQGLQDKTVAALLQALQDSGGYAHYAACRALTALAPHIKEAQQGETVAALLQTLQNGDEYVREAAYQTLTALAPHIKETQQGETVAALLQTLQNGDEYVREAAYQTLTALAPHIKEAQQGETVAALLQTLQNGDEYVREAAYQTLTALAPHIKKTQQGEALAALLQALKDSDEGVRYAACQALTTLVPYIHETQQSEALAALLQALQDNDEDVRQAACQALTTLVPYIHQTQQSEALAALLQALQDNDEDVRYAACQALTTLVPYIHETQQSEALAALLQALQDNDEEVRRAACQALTTLVPYIYETQQSETVAALLQALQDNDEDVRRAAYQALTALAPHIKETQQGEIVAALLQALQDSDKYVRQAACQALTPLAPHIKETQQGETVAVLLQVLKNGAIYSATDALTALAPHIGQTHQAELAIALLPLWKTSSWPANKVLQQLSLETFLEAHLKNGLFSEALQEYLVQGVWAAQSPLVLSSSELTLHRAQALAPSSHERPAGLSELVQGRVSGLEGAFKTAAGW